MHSTVMRLGLALVLAASQSVAAEVCSEVKISGHPDFSPVIWAEGGQIRGIGAVVALTLLEQLGVPVQHDSGYPYKRVQRMLARGQIDMVALMARNQERENYALFIDPPYAYAEAVIWSRADDPRKIDTLADLNGLQGALRFGTTYGQSYDDFFAQQSVDRIHDIHTAFKILLNGRVDYVVYDRLRSELLFRQQGWEGKFKYGTGVLNRNPLNLAISKKSPCVSLAPRISKGLEKMLENNHVEKIIEEQIEAQGMMVK